MIAYDPVQGQVCWLTLREGFSNPTAAFGPGLAEYRPPPKTADSPWVPPTTSEALLLSPFRPTARARARLDPPQLPYVRRWDGLRGALPGYISNHVSCPRARKAEQAAWGAAMSVIAYQSDYIMARDSSKPRSPFAWWTSTKSFRAVIARSYLATASSCRPSAASGAARCAPLPASPF